MNKQPDPLTQAKADTEWLRCLGDAFFDAMDIEQYSNAADECRRIAARHADMAEALEKVVYELSTLTPVPNEATYDNSRDTWPGVPESRRPRMSAVRI